MKNLTISVSLFFFFLLASGPDLFSQQNQDWQWLHEKPQGNTLRWVKAWDANNWYALGLAGTFMKTTDGGNNWYFHHSAGAPATIVGSGTTTRYAAHFFNQNTGVAVGVGRITRTTDGGLTFDTVGTNLPSGTINNIFFLNNNTGYVVGASTLRLAKTTDAGLTWTVNLNPPSATYYDVYSPNDTLIIITSTTGNIRRSTDGGATWATIASGQSFTIYKIAFKDPLNGWITGSAGKALYTTDAGLTWNNASTGLPTGTTFYDIDFVGNQVVLTGDPFYLYSTTNNGATWNTIDFLAPVSNQPWTGTYYSTDFLGNDFVTVGQFGLINSKFSNVNSVYTTLLRPGTIYDVWADTTGKIITVGAPSTAGVFDQIFISTDGGNNWQFATTTLAANNFSGDRYLLPAEIDAEAEDKESSDFTELVPNSTATFRSIDMIDSNLGYIVGSNSAVYRTTNGGLVWDSVTTTITPGQTLYKVDFINANTGWVFSNTSDAGTIWKTTDAGVSWTQQVLTGQTGNDSRIYGAHMLNDTLGWVVNYTPRPFKTTDGGNTWTLQPLSDSYGGFLYDIQMINENLGYCVGGGGRFYRTTDSGNNWMYDTIPNIPSGVVVTNYNVNFVDANYGMISTGSGFTFATTDGGVNWTAYGTSGATLYGLVSVRKTSNQLDIYTAGSFGYVFKFQNYFIPVEMVSFNANVSGQLVALSWVTATEINNQGFAIERKSLSNDYTQIAFVSGKGTTTERQSYYYVDNVSSGKYIYRLKQIDFDGSYTYSNEIEVDVNSPIKFALEQNFPNPFNPVTTISYSIPVDGFVNLAVYNLIGEKVAELVNSNVRAGSYQMNFDASKLSSGVYFYKLQTGSYSDTKKMILMK
jgi:photosystem II stability/assembly factor-like uncharacterized protein